jgi:hypothetical protein
MSSRQPISHRRTDRRLKWLRILSTAVAIGVVGATGAALPATAATCGSRVTVATTQALVAAAGNSCVTHIVVQGDLADAPSFDLSPGQTLSGGTRSAGVSFVHGVDGVQLSRNNSVANLELSTDPSQRAIFNNTQVGSLGTIRIAGVRTIGQVQLLAKDNVRGGNVAVNGLDIQAADTSPRTGLVGVFFGAPLEAMQGAFTLWNSQSDPSVVVKADLQGISIGRDGAPVIGSGVFVSGAFPLQVDSANVARFGDILHEQSTNPSRGSVEVQRLSTGSVYTHGSSVFSRNGAVAGSIAVFDGPSAPIESRLKVNGSVSTAGLTNGGINVYSDLQRLEVEGGITSTGPNGFGVVTWPHVGTIDVAGKLETFGTGSRGFNAYAGEVGVARFGQIVTHGDGAVAVDVFRPVHKLIVEHGIQTSGGTGPSLVLGQLKPLQASAIGAAELVGSIGQVVSGGPISSAHDGISTVHVGTANSIGALCARAGVQSTAGGLAFDVLGSLRLTCDAVSSTRFDGNSQANCVDTSNFTYSLDGLTSERILSAVVYVNDKPAKYVTAVSSHSFKLAGLPHGPFELKSVATTSSGERVVDERNYFGCVS